MVHISREELARLVNHFTLVMGKVPDDQVLAEMTTLHPVALQRLRSLAEDDLSTYTPGQSTINALIALANKKTANAGETGAGEAVSAVETSPQEAVGIRADAARLNEIIALYGVDAVEVVLERFKEWNGYGCGLSDEQVTALLKEHRTK